MIDVKGSFVVGRNYKWSSNIKYQMLFLEDRLLFVRVTGLSLEMIGLVTLVALVVFFFFLGSSFFGLIGAIVGAGLGAFIGLIPQKIFVKKAKRKNEELRNRMPSSVDDAMEADKKNFQIKYDDILKTEIKESSSGGTATYGINRGILFIDGKEKIRLDILDDHLEELKNLASLYLKG